MFDCEIILQRRENKGIVNEAIVVQTVTYMGFLGIRQCLRGDVIDGTTIPRIFWSVFGSPFVGKHVRAAAFHDSAYIHQDIPKTEADNIFREMLKIDGVNRMKRNAMYAAVCVFGKYTTKAQSDTALDELEI